MNAFLRHQGLSNRVTALTNMNAESSRSHCCLIVTAERRLRRRLEDVIKEAEALESATIHEDGSYAGTHGSGGSGRFPFFFLLLHILVLVFVCLKATLLSGVVNRECDLFEP